MANVIDRVKAQKWFVDLPGHEQELAIQSLMRDPRAQERIIDILDNIQGDPQWADLTLRQQQEQVMGALELERTIRLLRESLEELEWYEDLGPDDQLAVRRTVELNARIQRATLRTVRRADEAEIQASNPWQHMLR
jgi:hypothetical protein